MFTEADVVDYRSWKAHDAARNARFNRVLREHGVFKSPAKLYPSLAIDDDDLELTRDAYRAAAAALAG